MMKLGKVIEKIVLTVSVVFLLWVGVSYIDIVADNLSENPVHSEYNLFVMMTRGLE